MTRAEVQALRTIELVSYKELSKAIVANPEVRERFEAWLAAVLARIAAEHVDQEDLPKVLQFPGGNVQL